MCHVQTLGGAHHSPVQQAVANDRSAPAYPSLVILASVLAAKIRYDVFANKDMSNCTKLMNATTLYEKPPLSNPSLLYVCLRKAEFMQAILW
jgi:hypothetical protein